MSVNANHLAKLSNIPLSKHEADTLSDQFEKTLDVVGQLEELDTKKVEPTPQVTGLQNIFREDEIDEQRQLTQEQALKNAPQSYQGYFRVTAIFTE